MLLVGVATASFLLFALFPSYWPLLLSTVLLIGIVFGSAKWHAYFAPIAKTIKVFSWQDAGSEMETVLEVAQVHAATYGGASSIRQETWRISIYDRTRGKRKRRIMIGDSVKYLGDIGGYYWFFIEDRFYCPVSGLTAFDRQHADIAFNRPPSEGEFLGRTGHSHVIKMQVDDQEIVVDLKELASSVKTS